MQQGDPIFDMLSKIAGGGWADLDSMSASLEQQHRAVSSEEKRIADEQAAIVQAALSTDSGKALLDLLIRKTILRPPGDLELGAVTAEAYAIAKAKREGQNNVIFMLLGMLQHTTDKPAPGGDL